MLDRILGADRRLVPLISMLLVAGFLATSLASFFVSRDSVRASIESGLPLTTDNIYSEIQKDLLRPIFIASMMAHDRAGTSSSSRTRHKRRPASAAH